MKVDFQHLLAGVLSFKDAQSVKIVLKTFSPSLSRTLKRSKRSTARGADCTTSRDPSSYHSGEVDGHEWVRRQEEIIDPQNMPEIWQDVSVPCDQPAEGEDGAHLRTATQTIIYSSNMLHQLMHSKIWANNVQYVLQHLLIY